MCVTRCIITINNILIYNIDKQYYILYILKLLKKITHTATDFCV